MESLSLLFLNNCNVECGILRQKHFKNKFIAILVNNKYNL